MEALGFTDDVWYSYEFDEEITIKYQMTKYVLGTSDDEDSAFKFVDGPYRQHDKPTKELTEHMEGVSNKHDNDSSGKEVRGIKGAEIAIITKLQLIEK